MPDPDRSASESSKKADTQPASTLTHQISTAQSKKGARLANIIWVAIYLSWTAYLIYVAVQVQNAQQ